MPFPKLLSHFFNRETVETKTLRLTLLRCSLAISATALFVSVARYYTLWDVVGGFATMTLSFVAALSTLFLTALYRIEERSVATMRQERIKRREIELRYGKRTGHDALKRGSP